MGRLIEIQEIDEFSEVGTVSDDSINDTIIANTRQLSETDIERIVRKIIYDPDETPHGPTEIADVFTEVRVHGDKRSVAFVIKGKSFQTVRSRDVTHQFVKLFQIPRLGLMVLAAVGNIQDDARRDFLEVASKIGCDHIIINAHQIARLFIAYGKICPEDGTPYDQAGVCMNGHERTTKQILRITVAEETRYEILDQEDVSHAGAKRYSAIVLLDPHYTKDMIKGIIEEATDQLKNSTYYRNELVRQRWGETSAHVVWLYIASDLRDIQHSNWICHTRWIDPSLSEDMSPSGFEANDTTGEIDISWNDNYEVNKEFVERHHSTKEQVLETNRRLLKEMIPMAHKAIKYFETYSSEEITEKELIQRMKDMEARVDELYEESGNVPFPPPDCADYDEACQNIFATVHDMFFYYSEPGVETWDEHRRTWMMKEAVHRFAQNVTRLEFEEEKLR